LETKKNATELSIARLEEDNRKLHDAYNEGMMCNCASFLLGVVVTCLAMLAELV
jgi:hypothetical protein